MRSLPAAWLLPALLLMLAACGDKVSQANFQRVQLGMTEAEVKKILGTPSQSRTNIPPAALRLTAEQAAALTFTESIWHGDKGSIRVTFHGGKASRQNFFPPGVQANQGQK